MCMRAVLKRTRKPPQHTLFSTPRNVFNAALAARFPPAFSKLSFCDAFDMMNDSAVFVHNSLREQKREGKRGMRDEQEVL